MNNDEPAGDDFEGLYELAADVIDGTASEAQRAELEERLRADPEARRAYLRYALLHAELSLTDAAQMARAAETAAVRIDPPPHRPGRPRARRWLPWTIAAAACLVAMLATGPAVRRRPGGAAPASAPDDGQAGSGGPRGRRPSHREARFRGGRPDAGRRCQMGSDRATDRGRLGAADGPAEAGIGAGADRVLPWRDPRAGGTGRPGTARDRSGLLPAGQAEGQGVAPVEPVLGRDPECGRDRPGHRVRRPRRRRRRVGGPGLRGERRAASEGRRPGFGPREASGGGPRGAHRLVRLPAGDRHRPRLVRRPE